MLLRFYLTLKKFDSGLKRMRLSLWLYRQKAPVTLQQRIFNQTDRLKSSTQDQHIATLDQCDGLNMEIQVCRSRGYEFGEEHLNYNQQIGVIPVDSKFSPVRKVNFVVEETRVGHMTNYDRLILEVWTDASITAKEAVNQASDILLDQFRLFSDFDETYVEPVEEVDEEELQREKWLSKPVAELELSVRSANCLEAAKITTIRDLVVKTEQEMLKFRNFGRNP